MQIFLPAIQLKKKRNIFFKYRQEGRVNMVALSLINK